MFKSRHPRDLFNEIKWRFDLNRCKIYYIHRGAPGNVKILEGSKIKKIDRSFLVLEGVEEETYIPYHRIFRIEFNNHILFDRPIKPLPRKKRL